MIKILQKLSEKIMLVVVMLCVLLPLVLLIIQSFSSRWVRGELAPFSFTLRGWSIVWQEPLIWQAAATTWLVALVVVILNMILGFPAAHVLAYRSFRGKALIDGMLMLPILIPALAIAMGLHFSLLKIGLANSILAVALVHLIPTLPYTVRILRSAYENIGLLWLEQARTLGASPLYALWSVALPLLVPAIRTAIFLVVLISLSQYALTAIIGGGNVITWAMIYYPYLRTVEESVLASFSILYALMPIVFLMFSELLLRLMLIRR